MFKPSVIGVARLAFKVAEFGPIRKRRLQRRFEKQGAELVEAIKAATPVLKGTLRDSVRMVPAKKIPGVLIIAGGTPATARGPNLDEALLTEYGTRREQAEPFFWPTIRTKQGGLVADIADGANDASEDDDA